MSDSLRISLDELIRNGRRPRGRRSNHHRDRSQGSGPGPVRRAFNNISRTFSPYSTRQGMHEHRRARQYEPMRMAYEESSTKLYVSNLDPRVSATDIHMLFSEVGDLERHSIHYDRNGISKGTAEVVFAHHADAVAAIERYNNVLLDGKPIKIEIVGVDLTTTHASLQQARMNRPPSVFRRELGRIRRGQRSYGRSRGRGRGRGRGRSVGGRISSEIVKVEDLDAELESYHLAAMKIE